MALAALSLAVEFSHSRIILTMLNLAGLEMLATASMDCMISLWDLQTGKHKRSLEGHSKGVCCLSYSPEYRFLVSGGFDFDVIVWNPYVEHLILRLPGHTNSICGVEIVADSPQLVTADVDGVIRVWDVRNFACVQTFTVEDRWKAGISRFVSVYPHKELLAVGRAIHTFQYQHLDNPELTDDTPVFAALYNSTTTTLLTASVHHVRIWDARNGSLMRVYRGLGAAAGADDAERGELTTVAFDAEQRKLFIGDHGGRALSYNYLNGAWMATFEGDPPGGRAHAAEVSKIVYANEHNVVITASWDRSVHVYDDTEEGDSVLLRRMSGGHDADVTALAFSHNLSLIATGDGAGRVVVWDFEFGRLLGACDATVGTITHLAFADPFPALLSSDGSGTFHLWAVPPSRDRFTCLAAWQTDRAPPPSASDGAERAAAAAASRKTSATNASSILCFTLATQYAAPTKREAEAEAALDVLRIEAERQKSEAADPGARLRVSFARPASFSVPKPPEVPATATAPRPPPSKKPPPPPDRPIEKILILSGDDKGTISLWDIWPLLERLSAGDRFDVRRVATPVPCVNERRNLRYDASATVRGSDPTIDDVAEKKVTFSREAAVRARHALRRPKSPEPSPEARIAARMARRKRDEDDMVKASLRFARSYDLQRGIVRLRSFSAHADSVLSVHYIEESGAILSSGLDRLVHLWSLDGDRIGTLRQGVKQRGRGSNDWKFQISDVQHRQRRVSRARDVLRRMRDLEREQRAAAAAARAAMPHRTTDAPQLKAGGDGELHFVFNREQMDDGTEDDWGADDDAAGRDDDNNNLDALADLSGVRPVVHALQPEPPKKSPRFRPKPVGPGDAGRRLVPKRHRPKLK